MDYDEVDISNLNVGDTDFYGVSAASLLDSASATFGFCYDVDSTNYVITLHSDCD